RYADFSLTPDERQAFKGRLTAMRERFNAIEDPVEKNARLEILNKSESSLQVSPPQFSDLKVVYNPSPFAQFSAVLGEMWVTLKGLFTGNLSPKWLSGPVGIVEMVKENWKLGIGEGLYWVAMVSINLGVLNLLPIPILDGGNILLSGIEMVTGRRIKQSVLEKMILFCAVLLILFFLFVTYQDLLRIFGASLTRWV
ncbi:MAG: RIP metalloprotease, partial [Chlamydiia bacterium]|nr:RIP metalloprotease [Chlamydiia bacterium]